MPNSPHCSKPHLIHLRQRGGCISFGTKYPNWSRRCATEWFTFASHIGNFHSPSLTRVTLSFEIKLGKHPVSVSRARKYRMSGPSDGSKGVPTAPVPALSIHDLTPQLQPAAVIPSVSPAQVQTSSLPFSSPTAAPASMPIAPVNNNPPAKPTDAGVVLEVTGMDLPAQRPVMITTASSVSLADAVKDRHTYKTLYRYATRGDYGVMGLGLFAACCSGIIQPLMDSLSWEA